MLPAAQQAFTSGLHTVGLVSACPYVVLAAAPLWAFRAAGEPRTATDHHQTEMA